MNIYKLRVNHIEKPLGFNLENLSLSWIIEDNISDFVIGTKVEIAKDILFEDIVFDSGIRKNIDSLGYCPDIKLEKKTRYYWKVTAWGDKGTEGISDISWFETGKLNEKWEAKWITPDMDSEIHPLVRKEFNLPEEVESARMYICGLGFYELEINGDRIGDEYLKPGINSYDFWIQYQTFDVTENLIEGNNTIGISLGNGMYKGRFGFDGGYTNLYGDKFVLICELQCKLKDGSEITIKSDESFKSTESPVEFSGIYDGEIYNANKEIKDWSLSGLDTSNWCDVKVVDINKSKLKERMSLPVKIKEIIKPIELIETPKGEKVLDMGQNMSGWIRFRSKAGKGKVVKLQFAEVLQENCFYRENLRTAKAEFIYKSNGEERVVQPQYTYYGFRYVKLEGFEEININDFEGCVLYSDIENTGEITTSNELLNKLFQNAKWGQKGNFIDVPTDCPQRDERMGWTGDAQIFASTACFNMYSPAFYNKFLYDIYEEQKRRGGSVPYVVPSIKPENGFGFVDRDGAAVWGDAATIIPWTLYMHYGDKALLKSNFDSMKSWVDYIKDIDDKTGAKRLWNVGFQFGDWLALDGKEGDMIGGTDPYYVSSAYYCYSANIVGKAAKVLGFDDISEKYFKLSEEIKTAIQNEYFSNNGRSAINTQTAMLLALHLDLVKNEHRVRIIKDLKEKIKDCDNKLTTGFVGTSYLCTVLSDNNANKEAYNMILGEEFPGWLYAVKLGATTIWERWNSILPDGTISGTGMNSLNHYAYGSIVDWMYKSMCGINFNEDKPGFREIKLTPKPYGRIRYAEASFDGPTGKIGSRWEIKDDETLEFKFIVPFNTYAEVILPDAKIESIIINGENIKSKYKAESIGNDVRLTLNKGEFLISYKPTVCYILKYGINTSIEGLLNNEITKNVLEEILPEVFKSPLVNFISKKDSLVEFNPVNFGVNVNWKEKLEVLENELSKTKIEI